MLSKETFERQLQNLRLFYKNDNSWVYWLDWDNDVAYRKHIDCAYKLYTVVSSNRLKLTVLGGTEIRKNKELISAFGITAATGVQDGITSLYGASAAMDRYQQVNRPNDEAANPDTTYTPVDGGSILSEREWTPIMNDSLIIGAAAAKQYLALSLTPLEQLKWDRMNAHKITKYKVAASQFKGGEEPVKEAWREFFNENHSMFFGANGIPRVFTRELLGLISFGYKAEISYHQIGFRPPEVSKEPNFGTYVSTLRDVYFEANTLTSRKLITVKLSKFFFGSPDKLAKVENPLASYKTLKDDPLAPYRTLG
ncbi:hypothetical protein FLL45_04445 [Aliikangiella marina]|uniref:Uncharacterized protein n=1 Tax=Aliikangiella marina TaxID=1712262 RepID=A0A545TIZ7_9GAMM|nr:hypothetical protein [Aliikangiella marina]TQV77202.1 hypothetical protein FLL45_04445 [Aliikangiella marina]